MKWNFLYQITAASRTLTRGLPSPDPHSLCPLSSTEFVEPPWTKFLGTPLVVVVVVLVPPAAAAATVVVCGN
jgi:hypothetical protein